MKLLYTAICILILGSQSLIGQTYCEPTFAIGCFNWQTLSASIGSINYSAAPDCTVGDHTFLSTSANAGDTISVTVQNGVWCGVSIWVDFDQNLAFDTTENLYHQYVGGAPDYIYNFDIIVPAGTPNGSYRLRLISPWGSDGYSSTNMNGFGPCGAFQYGNYQDFTLNVGLGTDLPEVDVSSLKVYPNPATDQLYLEGLTGIDNELSVISAAGQLMIQWRPISGTTSVMDISMLPAGVYAIISDTGIRQASFTVAR